MEKFSQNANSEGEKDLKTMQAERGAWTPLLPDLGLLAQRAITRARGITKNAIKLQRLELTRRLSTLH